MTHIITLCFSILHGTGLIHLAGCHSDAGLGLLVSLGVWVWRCVFSREDAIIRSIFLGP